MSLALLRWFGSGKKKASKAPSRPTHRFFRPTLEGLEARDVPSAAPIAAPVLGPAIVAAAAPQPTGSVIPLSVTNVTVNNGQLMLNGLLGNQAFSAPLTLSTAASSPTTGSTRILDLHINPISLNLLGLTVNTSPICLTITAQSGPGNLLGNLLYNISNLLNPSSGTGGLPLSQVLNGLSATDLSTLTDPVNGLQGLLQPVFQQLTSTSAISGATTGQAAGHAGNILHLSLGPVNLDLLGLDVHLDNCSGGPVTLDIGAQPGPGNLLGNLLNSVTHLLDGSANQNAINNALGRLTGTLDNLLGTL